MATRKSRPAAGRRTEMTAEKRARTVSIKNKKPKKAPAPKSQADLATRISPQEAEVIRLITMEAMQPAAAWMQVFGCTKAEAVNQVHKKMHTKAFSAALSIMRYRTEVALAPTFTQDTNLMTLFNLTRTDPADYFSVKANGDVDFVPFEALPVEKRRRIQEFKLIINKDGSRCINYRFHDVIKASAEINRMLGWIKDPRVEDKKEKESYRIGTVNILQVPEQAKSAGDYDRSLANNQRMLQRLNQMLLGDKPEVLRKADARTLDLVAGPVDAGTAGFLEGSGGSAEGSGTRAERDEATIDDLIRSDPDLAREREDDLKRRRDDDEFSDSDPETGVCGPVGSAGEPD